MIYYEWFSIFGPPKLGHIMTRVSLSCNKATCQSERVQLLMWFAIHCFGASIISLYGTHAQGKGTLPWTVRATSHMVPSPGYDMDAYMATLFGGET